MGTVRRQKRLWPLYALIAVLVATILALLGSMLATGSGDSNQTQSDGESGQADDSSPLDSLARRNADDPMARGQVDAPVVMVAYEDFRCPFCAKFANDTAPKLIERYVDEGVLRIEWRDFPIFGDKSMRAAKAGRAAARQDMFWQFHEEVFSHAPPRGHPDLPKSELLEHAEQAGIPDMKQFRSDMKDPAVAKAIRKDANEATRIGASSTPTFIVNGTPIIGAQPLDKFVSTIEDAKEAAK